MEGGYVLDFSNRSFAEFIKGSIGINIYDDYGRAIGIQSSGALVLVGSTYDRTKAARDVVVMRLGPDGY